MFIWTNYLKAVIRFVILKILLTLFDFWSWSEKSFQQNSTSNMFLHVLVFNLRAESKTNDGIYFSWVRQND
jgi:hypothetical protein